MIVAFLVLVFLLQGCLHGEDEPDRTDTVVIPGPWEFLPRTALVEPAETLTWINQGSHAHTVTFSGDDGIDLDVTLQPGEQTEYTFNQVGTYEYECTFHLPDMVGTVVVEDG